MKNPPSEQDARITEIFSSLQGEGPYAGQRHIFVRFEECHIECTYCDELGKPARNYSVTEVIAEVRKLELECGPHSFISFTGGEPLLYITFLKHLLPELKLLGMKIYLETNGILWNALREILGWCDCIAMDMKPSSVTGEKNFDEDHRRFLQIAVVKDTFVKMVLSKSADEVEVLKQIAIVRQVASGVPVIFQPISDVMEGHEDPELMKKLERLQIQCLKIIHDVRIVPRLHKILKMR